MHDIEALRPRLHFTPPSNWINDPNGMVRVGDVFHLFYQHNPTDIGWGNLHWGHATSNDLLGWEHRPVALAPDHLGEIFSGTAVVDEHDTAGFGVGAMVAVFTHDLDGLQRQSLAASTDDGDTWEMYEHNPVLEAPEGVTDFRDPRIIRFDGEHSAWWVMVLAVGTEVWFYRSDDLRAWELTSALCPPVPRPGDIVEVPELVRVPVLDERGEASGWSWTLVFSLILQPHEHLTTPRVRWMSGEFDGATFRPEHPDAVARPFDCLPHVYAPLAWHAPDGAAPVVIGWMDEQHVISPTRPLAWSGRQSIPRSMYLARDSAGTTDLVQRPVELGAAHRERRGFLLSPSGLDEPADSGVQIVDACFAIELGGRLGAVGDVVRLTMSGIDETGEVHQLVVNEQGYAADGVHLSSCRIEEGSDECTFDVELLVDTGSLEIFAAEGRAVASSIVGLGIGATSVWLEATPGVRFDRCDVIPLRRPS